MGDVLLYAGGPQRRGSRTAQGLNDQAQARGKSGINPQFRPARFGSGFGKSSACVRSVAKANRTSASGRLEVGELDRQRPRGADLEKAICVSNGLTHPPLVRLDHDSEGSAACRRPVGIDRPMGGLNRWCGGGRG
jgi:hypothetical protein